jgi:hypothetical protein
MLLRAYDLNTKSQHQSWSLFGLRCLSPILHGEEGCPRQPLCGCITVVISHPPAGLIWTDVLLRQLCTPSTLVGILEWHARLFFCYSKRKVDHPGHDLHRHLVPGREKSLFLFHLKTPERYFKRHWKTAVKCIFWRLKLFFFTLPELPNLQMMSSWRWNVYYAWFVTQILIKMRFVRFKGISRVVDGGDLPPAHP